MGYRFYNVVYFLYRYKITFYGFILRFGGKSTFLIQ